VAGRHQIAVALVQYQLCGVGRLAARVWSRGVDAPRPAASGGRTANRQVRANHELGDRCVGQVPEESEEGAI
jgi:hypothetical protein